MSDDKHDLDRIGKAMQAAWSRVKKAQTRMWSEWMVIGEGLLEGRRWAMRIAGVNRPEGKGYTTAFAEWLTRYKVDDMDKGDRAKLLQLMEERPAVEEWRATLTDHERRNLNNPTSVWRKWTAATRVKKPKSRTAGYSATEMGRARDMVQQQDERIRELEEELAAARDEAGDAAHTFEPPFDTLVLLGQSLEHMRLLEPGGFDELAAAARSGNVFGYDELVELSKHITALAAALKKAAEAEETGEDQTSPVQEPEE